MVKHKRMSLFDAPKDSLIIHACNSKGMWGSEIAKQFSLNYPFSYSDYRRFCEQWNCERGTACGLAGYSQAHVSEQHWVGWIVTSHDYGNNRDRKEVIKINTVLAMQDLCEKIYKAHPRDSFPTIDVYSNKFNSGLFGVPWEDSELILKTVLRDFKRINWIVCDPNGGQGEDLKK